MPNDLSTLGYRTSILTRLIKIIPHLDREHAFDILDKSTKQQLNRYWALITKKEFDTLRKEFDAGNKV